MYARKASVDMDISMDISIHGYPRKIWIWIWMGNFISTASLVMADMIPLPSTENSFYAR